MRTLLTMCTAADVEDGDDEEDEDDEDDGDGEDGDNAGMNTDTAPSVTLVASQGCQETVDTLTKFPPKLEARR